MIRFLYYFSGVKGENISFTGPALQKPHTKRAMNAMDQTIAGAASGESAHLCSAEGFTISGKRTEE